MTDRKPMLRDADWGERFLKFMSDHGPYPKTELRAYMDETFQTPQERILASFTLVATGCWRRGATDAHIAETTVEQLGTIHGIRDTETRSTVVNTLERTFAAIDSEEGVKRNDWLHNHRYRYLNTKSPHGNRAEDVVRSLSYLSSVTDKYTDLHEYISTQLRDASEPFWTIFSEIHEHVHGFSRLSVFDFLEIANRAGGIGGLYPEVPRYEYFSSNKPQSGLKLVFCGDRYEDPSNVKSMSEKEMLGYLSITKAERDQLGKALYEASTARSEVGWDERTAIYDIESCLCNFAKSRNDDYWKADPVRSPSDNISGAC